ncbi:AI-2E family transporter [Phenylobacterium sp.]|uniref:AI-2E family transporter n=1 Tax=Phenylobacterium sp. TaxID=1871053 RepID=UPI0025CEC42D|nr:AI-2E family transporter [Phenylobacterium sp.]MBX3486187.1 AI-2E family transporter [Phenylobacterium sp.]MCW5759006.1 AI-2E family transporter [Phenylobacterium sp.]
MPAPRPLASAVADPVARNALVILATIAGGLVLYLLSDILTPLALAIFLALMIDGFARVLQNRMPGVSGRVATPLAIALSIVIFGGAAFFIADNAASFAGQLVGYAPKLNGLIARVAGMVGMDVPPTITQLIQRADPASHLGQVARGLQSFVSTAAFVLVYLGFILASRRGWERKAVSLFENREQRQEAVAAFMRIRNGVEQYLWVQTVTGLMIAVASWIAMVSVGLDNALFWSILIFIASYIPVVGGIIAVVLPPVFALVQFDTLWQAIVLFVVLQAIGMFVGNVIQPRMQGRSLNMDPIVLLMALAFWSVVWGLPGAFLSTPLTTVMMVVLMQFRGARWIAVLLSADGEPGELRKGQPHDTPDAGPVKPAARRRSKAQPKKDAPGT